MIHVIARSRIKPGRREEFLRILKANVPTVLAEKGCIRYEPCVDADAGVGGGPDPDCVTILESWESPEHLRAHLATSHMAAFRDAVTPLRESSVLSVVTTA